MTMDETENRPDFIPTKEAAAFLCVPLGTLVRWRRQGTGPRYVRYARKCLYSRRDLAAFVADKTVDRMVKQEGAAHA